VKVLILGVSGYKGSILTQQLFDAGHEVAGVDITGNPTHRMDVRNIDKLRGVLKGQDAVIHLACISNDPSAELDPALTKSINLDCFQPCVEAARDAGVKRFIYASSSSVYGVKQEKDVTEDLPLEPLTDYSRFKAECEKILFANKGSMEAVVVRPATVCGWSPNVRLDLAVHILTMSALRNDKIKVFGGHQYRPNVHILDICRAYEMLLTAGNVDGEIFNCGTQNLTIHETAEMIQGIVGAVKIEVTPSDDHRSYHVSSDKIMDKIGWKPRFAIATAITELKFAWEYGYIKNPDDEKYHRIKYWKKHG